MQAIIMAAGRGVRLRPITERVPKCMVAVKGKPLLERVLTSVISAGITELNLVVGYKKEIIEDHFGPKFEGVKITYFVQQEPKGTAHAVSLLQDYIKGKFFVANADVLASTRDYKRLIRVDEDEEFNGLVLARKDPEPWKYGVIKTKGNMVDYIVEKPNPDKEPSNLVNAGIYRFDSDFMDAVMATGLSQRGEYELVDSMRNYIAAGKRVDCVRCEDKCVDISDIEDLKMANQMDEAIFPK
ncbi:MAG TPA: sugar phosphate nucleotidyltransferase [archaeon]|nr:sugar phosphate nucleotidyltransferase [archaeon]